MSFIVGPTTWWVKSKEAADYYARACPPGTILQDGSAVYRKAGGLAWIVSPFSTQVSSQWIGGQCPGVCIGTTKTTCCICEWSALCSALLNNCFNPCDWFVPDQSTLFTAYQCAVAGCWGGASAYSPTTYWSSSEGNASIACLVSFNNGSQDNYDKSSTICVRSVRCINL
jgi:hypothetical protein